MYALASLPWLISELSNTNYGAQPTLIPQLPEIPEEDEKLQQYPPISAADIPMILEEDDEDIFDYDADDEDEVYLF